LDNGPVNGVTDPLHLNKRHLFVCPAQVTIYLLVATTAMAEALLAVTMPARESVLVLCNAKWPNVHQTPLKTVPDDIDVEIDTNTNLIVAVSLRASIPLLRCALL
jgi:hypothetical protein